MNIKNGRINNHIKESSKKSYEKSLIDNISKRLFKLEFKPNNSIKSRCVKFIVKKYISIIIKHANSLFKL